MFDQLCIVNRGGLVLWSWEAKKRAGASGPGAEPVNSLIQNILLEDRASEKEYTKNDYKLKWVLHNEAGFFVVAVVQKVLQLLFLDQLLLDVKNGFAQMFATSATAPGPNPVSHDFSSFDEKFRALLSDFEIKERAAGSRETVQVNLKQNPGSPTTNPESPTSPKKPGVEMINGRIVRNKNPTETTDKKKPGKASRKWVENEEGPGCMETGGSNGGEVTEEDRQAAIARQVEMQRAQFLKKDIKTGQAAKTDVNDSSEMNVERGRFKTWLRGFVGSRELDDQDFRNVIPQIKDKLISKNVAVDVAENVCESVQASLKGKKLGQLESLHTAIESAMVEALHRILRGKVQVDILRSIERAKERKKPYSIVFCGVNGVGKSTSLSKVAYWLQQNGLSIMFAAGDTFRRGAVEQLEVHGRCLDIPTFQLGYGTDPTEVAKQALQFATKQGIDVVLIDTAGRMQDHEPRMVALANLIHKSSPDLVLFVGEALVGNNGIDQLSKFNNCLHTYTPVGSKPRGIDGIVLTKFDTIDDKVGAAVSMVYQLGQPIVFVGVGQTYQDLKTIQADVVVDALMK